MHGVGVAQMKEKYTKMRPYGEWLAEQTVVLQQLIDSVGPEQRQSPPVLPAGARPTNGAVHVSALTDFSLHQLALCLACSV